MINKALDIYIVVSRSHVVQAVAVGNYAVLTVVDELYAVRVAREQLAVCAVAERIFQLAVSTGNRSCTAYVVEVVVKITVISVLLSKQAVAVDEQRGLVVLD